MVKKATNVIITHVLMCCTTFSVSFRQNRIEHQNLPQYWNFDIVSENLTRMRRDHITERKTIVTSFVLIFKNPQDWVVLKLILEFTSNSAFHALSIIAFWQLPDYWVPKQVFSPKNFKSSYFLGRKVFSTFPAAIFVIMISVVDFIVPGRPVHVTVHLCRWSWSMKLSKTNITIL